MENVRIDMPIKVTYRLMQKRTQHCELQKQTTFDGFHNNLTPPDLVRDRCVIKMLGTIEPTFAVREQFNFTAAPQKKRVVSQQIWKRNMWINKSVITANKALTQPDYVYLKLSGKL